jgi:hypothetical protein
MNTLQAVIVDLSRLTTELFLPEYMYLTLDSVVLGDNFLNRTHFVDVACEGGLAMVELGLELRESGCRLFGMRMGKVVNRRAAGIV